MKKSHATDKLYEHAPEHVKKLQKQARREQREKQRRDWWQQNQKQNG